LGDCEYRSGCNNSIDRSDYEQTPANESLVYHDCFDGFKCAKLQVPLDWTAEEGTDNRTAEIALIKVPAIVPVTDSRYAGPVVLNPGESQYNTSLYDPVH
jgi:hypothetical protein